MGGDLSTQSQASAACLEVKRRGHPQEGRLVIWASEEEEEEEEQGNLEGKASSGGSSLGVAFEGEFRATKAVAKGI